MTDDNTQLTDNETKTEEPVVETLATEEPMVEVPVSSTPAPADDTVVSTSTDQMGRQLYNVKCAKCGKDAQVPFKPSGDRPVYCRDCYAQQRNDR